MHCSTYLTENRSINSQFHRQGSSFFIRVIDFFVVLREDNLRDYKWLVIYVSIVPVTLGDVHGMQVRVERETWVLIYLNSMRDGKGNL